MTSRDVFSRLDILPKKTKLTADMIRVYMSVLSAYPTDTAEKAVSEIIDNEFLFPPVAVLRKYCDRTAAEKAEKEARTREQQERKNTKTWLDYMQEDKNNQQLAKDCCNLIKTARTPQQWKWGIQRLAKKYPDMDWKSSTKGEML